MMYQKSVAMATTRKTKLDAPTSATKRERTPKLTFMPPAGRRRLPASARPPRRPRLTGPGRAGPAGPAAGSPPRAPPRAPPRPRGTEPGRGGGGAVSLRASVRRPAERGPRVPPQRPGPSAPAPAPAPTLRPRPPPRGAPRGASGPCSWPGPPPPRSVRFPARPVSPGRRPCALPEGLWVGGCGERGAEPCAPGHGWGSPGRQGCLPRKGDPSGNTGRGASG